MNKIIQEHFLDNLVFRFVAILKSINKIFKKELQRNVFKVGDSKSIIKIFEKHLQRKLHSRKLFCIYEQNL